MQAERTNGSPNAPEFLPVPSVEHNDGFRGRRTALLHLFRLNTLLFVANASTGAVNYLYHVVVGHLLNPTEYGTVAALVNLTYVILIPTTIILTVFTRAAAALSTHQQMGQLRDLWMRLTVALLCFGLLATALFSLGLSDVVARFFQIPTSRDVVALMGLLYVVGFVWPLNQGILQGTQRFGWLAAMTAGGPILRVLLAAIFIMAGLGVRGAVLGLVLASAVPYLVSFAVLREPLRRSPRQRGPLRPWLGYSTAVAISTICTTLLYNLDTILAKHFLSGVAAGQYAALANTGKIVLFIGGSVVIIMFPKVAAAHARGERHGHYLAFSLGATFALAVSVLGVFFLFSHFVMTHLFGPAYSIVSSELPWYGLAMLFFSLSGVFTQYFLSLDNRTFLWVVIACCLGQTGALLIWHSSVTQMVHVLVISMGILLASLTTLYLAHARHDPAALPSSLLGTAGGAGT